MRRTARTFAAIAAATLIALVAGCGSSTESPEPQETTAGFPVTVGSVTLEQRPERIVSLSPTATETLFAIDAGAQVVAADEFSNYPAQAPRTDLSGYQPNAEAVATYQPDLVVVVDDLNGIVGQLTALGIPTYVAPSATSLDDVYTQITDLGALTGHAAEAEALVNQMRDDIAKLIADLPQRETPLTYYYELDNNYYSVTSDTFVGSLLSNAGLVNIADAAAEGSDYPKLSAEVIISADPDLIFLADATCCGESAETVAARPGWGNLKAVSNGSVVELDSDIASRWGPRVVDLQRVIVEAVARVPVG